ncbi:MAG: DUF87 domain-containing protein [Candidatus Pacebacteria bacterium]|nr:DUF87 domain-containing protein [Candidatus Paceibacterota bacterium]
MYIFLGILLIVIVSVLFFLFKKKSFNLEIKTSLDYQLFLITIPRDFYPGSKSSGQEKQTVFADFISFFIQTLENLGKYNKEIVFEIAISSDSSEICFYAACAKKDIQFFEKILSASFPYASIELVNDYTIFLPQGEIAGATLNLKEPFALPLKTFDLFSQDPLTTIVNAFSKLSRQEEGAAFQIVIKPETTNKIKELAGIKKALMEGKDLKQALASPLSSMFTREPEKKPEEELKPKIIDENLIKLIDEKSKFPLFHLNARILTSALTKSRAEELLSHLEASFSPFARSLGNSFTCSNVKSKSGLKRLVYDFSFRIFRKQNAMLLNTAEIASIFHFPHPFLDNASIKWLKARSAAAPLNLPQQGVSLGVNVFQREEKEVRILDDDRRRHLYIIGQTGTGKTSLMRNLFIQDMKEGKGVCYIDPHGDTAEYLVGLVPDSRAKDLVYFNPGDFHNSFGLNMLERDEQYPFQKTFVVDELLEILDKLYDLKQVGGPVFEQYFRNALLLLLDDPEEIHTLNDLPRILINVDFRKRLLEKTPNPMVREFWEKEAEKAGGDLALANVAPYINSKLNPFLANDLVRPIISQKKSAIDFRKVMDEGKILIINLSKGLLGDINSYLLGMLIVGKLTMAAFSRVDIPEEQRKDFYLYIDEFQNITTDTIATIFSEARKYRLNLVVTNQFLAQLKEPIIKSVFGNVGTLISFRVGNEDAEFLEKYFAPVFNAYDLINLDNFNAYTKLTIQGQPSRAFNIKIHKPPESDQKRIESLKQLSVSKYTRPRAEVEEELRKTY